MFHRANWLYFHPKISMTERESQRTVTREACNYDSFDFRWGSGSIGVFSPSQPSQSFDFGQRLRRVQELVGDGREVGESEMNGIRVVHHLQCIVQPIRTRFAARNASDEKLVRRNRTRPVVSGRIG